MPQMLTCTMDLIR